MWLATVKSTFHCKLPSIQLFKISARQQMKGRQTEERVVKGKKKCDFLVYTCKTQEGRQEKTQGLRHHTD